eukprot:GHVS01014669.1.p1 GENE.GHVS01014669.1~~GHVS01014669.1.p1  ORF type:complete len:558 (+),score=140.19 GHVS01014669.1:189-1676(+)
MISTDTHQTSTAPFSETAAARLDSSSRCCPPLPLTHDNNNNLTDKSVVTPPSPQRRLASVSAPLSPTSSPPSYLTFPASAPVDNLPTSLLPPVQQSYRSARRNAVNGCDEDEYVIGCEQTLGTARSRAAAQRVAGDTVLGSRRRRRRAEDVPVVIVGGRGGGGRRGRGGGVRRVISREEKEADGLSDSTTSTTQSSSRCVPTPGPTLAPPPPCGEASLLSTVSWLVHSQLMIHNSINGLLEEVSYLRHQVKRQCCGTTNNTASCGGGSRRNSSSCYRGFSGSPSPSRRNNNNLIYHNTSTDNLYNPLLLTELDRLVDHPLTGRQQQHQTTKEEMPDEISPYSSSFRNTFTTKCAPPPTPSSFSSSSFAHHHQRLGMVSPPSPPANNDESEASSAGNWTSGVRGVYFNKATNRWVASWREEGEGRMIVKRKYFGITRFGLKEAKRLAILCRTEQKDYSRHAASAVPVVVSTTVVAAEVPAPPPQQPEEQQETVMEE